MTSPHLCDAVIQTITSKLMEQADSQAALLSIMAMCGVSQHWRAVARHLEPTTLFFDSLASCGRNALGRPLNAAETAFRKASPGAKGQFFQAAAKLLSGYNEAEFAGDGITDLTLMEAARKVGDQLTTIAVKVGAFTRFGIEKCNCLETAQVATLLLFHCRTRAWSLMLALPAWCSSRAT